MISFQYQLLTEWPPLVWLAHCVVSKPVVTVFHGGRVEVRDAFFCEAVWDSEYEAGNFDLTDLVFGSGGRSRDEHVMFVSSGSTVDRLQTLVDDDGVWISNSLACLLAVTHTSFDPAFSQYYDDLGSIVLGLNNYKRRLESSVGFIQLMYFNNLKWDGKTLVEVGKPNEVRDFTTFTTYRNFLSSSLGRITENLSANGRRHPMRLLGTVSSGYDSATVAALARSHGLREAISFTEARGGAADDGRAIADRLGELTVIPRESWRSRHLAEVPFIAGDAKGEDVYFSGAENRLLGSVLLTGFHGDQMWARNPSALGADIIRKDRSGLSLTEYRLWVGFVHFPPAFMGVRQVGEVSRISKSPEMAPWDVAGKYSKPICRRILEDTGIPRNLFGVSKKATSVLFAARTDLLTSDTRKQYYDWLRQHSKPLYAAGQLLTWFYWPYKTLLRSLHVVVRSAPEPFCSKGKELMRRLEKLERDLKLFRYMFPWAIEKAKEHYSADHEIGSWPPRG